MQVAVISASDGARRRLLNKQAAAANLQWVMGRLTGSATNSRLFWNKDQRLVYSAGITASVPNIHE